jgi:hypothetical protein
MKKGIANTDLVFPQEHGPVQTVDQANHSADAILPNREPRPDRKHMEGITPIAGPDAEPLPPRQPRESSRDS